MVDKKMARRELEGTRFIGPVADVDSTFSTFLRDFLVTHFLVSLRCENEKSPLPTRDDVSGEGFDTAEATVFVKTLLLSPRSRVR